MKKFLVASVAVLILAGCGVDMTYMPEIVAGKEAQNNGIVCSRDFPEVDKSDMFACRNETQAIMVMTVVTDPDTDIKIYQQERPDVSWYSTVNGKTTYIVGVKK